MSTILHNELIIHDNEIITLHKNKHQTVLNLTWGRVLSVYCFWVELIVTQKRLDALQ